MSSSIDYPNQILPVIVIESSIILPHNTLRLEFNLNVADLLVNHNLHTETLKSLAIFTLISKNAKVEGECALLGSGKMIYGTGCIVKVTKMSLSFDGTEKQVSLLLKGIQRCTFIREDHNGSRSSSSSSSSKEAQLLFPLAVVKPYDLLSDEHSLASDEYAKLKAALKKQALMLWIMFPHLRAPNLLKLLGDVESNITVIADLIAQALDDQDYLSEKLAVLSARSVQEQITRTLLLLNKFRPMRAGAIQSSESTSGPVRSLPSRGGKTEDDNGDLQELRDKLTKTIFPDRVLGVVQSELKRLTKMSSSSPEYSVSRSYLEALLDFPWIEEYPQHGGIVDIKAVGTVLDEEHYGLQEIKARIMQFVAVMILRGPKKATAITNATTVQIKPSAQAIKSHPTILCLVGAPGVGEVHSSTTVALCRR
jgi:ATP-dependent Lon protease